MKKIGVAEPMDELISGSRLKLVGDLQHHPANQQRQKIYTHYFMNIYRPR
jgi:hypothetical protein